MKNLLAALFLQCFTINICVAQENNPLINSGELIQQAINLHDSGDYKKAIALYEKIDRNDTNYVYALYEKALSCSADSQYQRALGYCEEALRLSEDREREPEIYTQYASLVDALGKPERAIKIFDSAIAKYPAYSFLLLNKATTLIELDRIEEAQAVLQKTLVADPFCNSCHYMLGICAIKKGQLVPAFLSFIGYLVVSPDGRYSKKAIALLDAIAKNSNDIQEFVDKRKEEPSEKYKTIEQIIESKIALDKNYKPIVDLDDPISRQIQVVFEKMQFQETDPDFWMQYYMPYFSKIFASGKLEIFINHIFSSVNIKSIQEYIRKNKKEYQSFVNGAAEYFNLIRTTRQLAFTKRKEDGFLYIFSNGQLTGSGNYVAAADKLTGEWKFYFPAGNTNSMGLFNDNGKKEGVWNYYYYHGTIKGKEIYKDGKQEGEEVYYYKNGNISSEANYKNNLIDGFASSYYVSGAIEFQSNYKNGKLEGEKREYFSNGDLQLIENFSADVLNGPFKTFHQNGQLESTGSYVNGKLEGPFKSYYDDGNINSEGAYTKGLSTGTWNYYFENGKPKKVMAYNNGVPEGDYKEYFDNGQLFTSYQNRKGKTTGEVKYFDNDGKLYSILQFDDDKLRAGRYFDKTGKEISSSEIKGKRIDLTTYRADGTKRTQVSYTDKGDINGVETSFYWSGKIEETEQYNNSELEGPSITYYRNGQKKSEVNYSGGKKNGYYKSYYNDGTLESEGWFIMDKAEGNWIYYDEQGQLASKDYFIDDEKSGYKDEYTPNGKLQLETKYNKGWTLERSQFDTTGKLFNHIKFEKYDGLEKLLYPGGKPETQANYTQGNYNGPFTSYYFDGSIAAVNYYKKGLEDSLYRTYYYGGDKTIEGQYSLGKKSGIWKYFHPGNLPWFTEEFVNGKLNGHKIYYLENGGIDFDVMYKDDDRDGLGKKYEPGGQLIYQVRYEDDLPVGYAYLGRDGKLVAEIPIIGGTAKVKTYYQNGSIATEFEYVDGKVNGTDISYYPNGKKMVESMESYGSSEGIFKEFYADGQLKSEYNYLHDNLNGPYKEYNSKGILQEEGNYYNGTPHGLVKYYSENGMLKSEYMYYYGKLLSVKK